MPVGVGSLRRALPEDAENGLCDLMRRHIGGLYEELRHLDQRLDGLTREIEQSATASENCRRLMTIPGVGALSATMLEAMIGDADAFKNGRKLSAWLGLTPRQHSTGGKSVLLGISKRGDVYLRCLLVHGARAAMRYVGKKDDRRSEWVKGVMRRRHKNVAAVAMANKMARTAWALLKKGEDYRANYAVAA